MMSALLSLLTGVWISLAPEPKMAMILLPTSEARVSIAPPDAPSRLAHFRWGVRADSLCLVGVDGVMCWQARFRGRDTLEVGPRRYIRLAAPAPTPTGQDV